jgi:hypothetical protein
MENTSIIALSDQKKRNKKANNGRKTLHRKSKVEHSEPHKKKTGVNSGAPEV